MFLEKERCCEDMQQIYKRTPMEFLINKGLKPSATLLKRDSRFPLKFAKFLKTPMYFEEHVLTAAYGTSPSIYFFPLPLKMKWMQVQYASETHLPINLRL